MIALHKPQRATYGQAVEAQVEYAATVCTKWVGICVFEGEITCCK